MTAKSSKRFSLANAFRDLVDLFAPPSPTPFDLHLLADSSHDFQKRKRDWGSGSSGSSGISNASSRASFDSTSTAASSWAGSINEKRHSFSTVASIEGYWEGEGASRKWVSPFASPFPPRAPRPNARRHSRTSTFIESSIFAPNTFRFAASAEEEILHEEDETVEGTEEDLVVVEEEPQEGDSTPDEEEAVTAALQQSFARSGASHRRRGAISSASISVPAMRAIDFDIQIDNTGDPGCVARFMGLHLGGVGGDVTQKLPIMGEGIAGRRPSHARNRASPIRNGDGLMSVFGGGSVDGWKP
ncbi:hypothetical protein RQP46_006700 [Phenoliferia psychrophenolica]